MFTVGPPEKQATVYLDKDQLDRETIKQIEAINAHESVTNVRIMPDVHKGNGCCVGFTSKLTDSVLPGLIGGDIGCGIAMHPLPSSLLSKKNALTKLNKVIQRHVPMGNGYDRVHATPLMQPSQYATYFALAQQDATSFATAFETAFNLDIRPHMPTYSFEWWGSRCDVLGSNFDYDLRSLGTLGGGNHFVEINDGHDGGGYITVHTGSRNFGQRVARFHQGGGSTDRTRNVLLDDNNTHDIPRRPSRALHGAAASAYFFDMIWAQTYASMNRRAILSVVLNAVGVEFDEASIVESVHNYIDFRDLVIRKGAIRCHAGERCVVALNMRDGVLVCEGKGNTAWNMSGPHGCGRIRSRQAMQLRKGSAVNAAMRRFRHEMGDVESTCIVPETLDERPSAYRSADVIEQALRDTASVVFHAKTLLNVKGY
ncbi:hypothetical protein DYB37_000740 [Aphanomyces astaci]|uniref:3'-phosphate/5'-hydroxy nucleic acid ligase n=1 Tax=Aphanomyces astaci TaxID=112090 RepID=A0A3R6XT92_APHAT|nr:hypothetical protein DYB35_002766 [Aphanomyces astaci]RHZ22378.1 hypothetical protein DYB37_000740 [Aphanomyces astaci]